MTESNGRLVSSFVKHWAERRPLSTVLEAPEQSSMCYGDLWSQIEGRVAQLREYGIRSADRIALVLPNGAEAAAAFLTVSSAASCAPLNPAFRSREFAYYFKELNAKAVILHANIEIPAREVAENNNIKVIELVPDPNAIAGAFTLNFISKRVLVESSDTKSAEDALILHTSGTTSRPKAVPLTHNNLVASAESIQDTLALTERD